MLIKVLEENLSDLEDNATCFHDTTHCIRMALCCVRALATIKSITGVYQPSVGEARLAGLLLHNVGKYAVRGLLFDFSSGQHYGVVRWTYCRSVGFQVHE